MGATQAKGVYTAAKHISSFRYELIAGSESVKMREREKDVDEYEKGAGIKDIERSKFIV